MTFPIKLEEGHIPLFVNWEKYFRGDVLHELYFVQLGGNCGKNTPECAGGGDPVWEYATRFDWRGVVVEPVGKTFEQLRMNYKPFPNIQPLNVLVSNFSGTTDIQVNGEMSSEIKTSEGLAKQSVSAITVHELWQQLGPPPVVHLLVLDVEGSEPRILGTPLPEPLPHKILFEMAHLSRDELAGINNTLYSQGYKLLAKLKHQDETYQRWDHSCPKGHNCVPPQDFLYALKTEGKHMVAGKQSAAGKKNRPHDKKGNTGTAPKGKHGHRNK